MGIFDEFRFLMSPATVSRVIFWLPVPISANIDDGLFALDAWRLKI